MRVLVFVIFVLVFFGAFCVAWIDPKSKKVSKANPPPPPSSAHLESGRIRAERDRKDAEEQAKLAIRRS